MSENNSITELMGTFTPVPRTFIKEAKQMSYHARWLYVTLMFHRNTKSKTAFPSYTRITELTGMRREMISKSIKELEKSGWIVKKRRYSNSSNYYFNFKKVEEANETDSSKDEGYF
jgi:biotin operon repressor